MSCFLIDALWIARLRETLSLIGLLIVVGGTATTQAAPIMDALDEGPLGAGVGRETDVSAAGQSEGSSAVSDWPGSHTAIRQDQSVVPAGLM